MEYIYLLFSALLYFPLILADKLGSEGTEEKTMLFKYSFFRSIVGIVVATLALIFSGCRIKLDLYTILTSMAFGLFMGLQLIAVFYSMQVTTVAVSSMFKSASVIIPCFFGAVFLNDSISVINIIGIVLFLVSVYLIVSKTNKNKMKFSIKALVTCLVILCANGFGSVSMQLFGKCVSNGEETVFLFLAYCFQYVVLLITYLYYSEKNETQKNIRISKKMKIYGIIGAVAAFLIQQIMVKLSAEISALVVFPATMGSSVIMGVVVGWMCFKEKLTVKNISGVILGIVSLLLINLF